LGSSRRAFALSAAADQNAIDYRKHTMDAVGGHMKHSVRSRKESRREGPHSGARRESRGFVAHCARCFRCRYERRGHRRVAEDLGRPRAFKERLTAFQTAADDLDAVVKSGDMSKFGASLGALGKACKSCHDTFKKE
jgi:adenylosuccinate lyase